MERKLASIQVISALNPIENADQIEVADILGWKVVVKKGDFKAGDRCCYCEIDSLLPDRPEFEFLSKVKRRIKTIKLRGQISQGICFPLNISPGVNLDFPKETDVTELLGVVKYERPLHRSIISGLAKGLFPSYVPKTDETRIQSSPRLLKELLGEECYITTKMDGTSATFAIKDGEIEVCSRNLSRKDSEEGLYWSIARKYNIFNILHEVGNIAIQGEICGGSIQGNPMGLKEKELFIFNVFDIDQQQHYNFDQFTIFCKKHSLQTVPIDNPSFILNHSVEELLELAKGNYDNGKPREGIVIRPKSTVHSAILSGRASFKVINNDFLLKKK